MEDVMSSDGVTCSPMAPLPASSQPGMLEKWSSFSIPTGWGPVAEWVWGSLAVSPCHQLFNKGTEYRGGMLVHVAFLDCA